MKDDMDAVFVVGVLNRGQAALASRALDATYRVACEREAWAQRNGLNPRHTKALERVRESVADQGVFWFLVLAGVRAV